MMGIYDIRPNLRVICAKITAVGWALPHHQYLRLNIIEFSALSEYKKIRVNPVQKNSLDTKLYMMYNIYQTNMLK